MVLLGAGAGLAQQVPAGGAPGGPPSGAQEPAIQDPAIVAHVGAAKIAEIRGDVAAAESELRAALGKATGREQALVRRELLALLRRAGRTITLDEIVRSENPAGATPPERPADPLAELVAMLDRDLMSETVDITKQELARLGVLAVPALLAALPKFGPFGITNALAVLQSLDDPRIGPALLQLAATSDPAVAVTIGNKLPEMPPAVALPIARAFADAQRPVAAQLAALRWFVRNDPDGAGTRELAQRLAAEPTGAAAATVRDVVSALPQDWVLDVFVALRRHATEDVRVAALHAWLLRQPQVTEAEAQRLWAGLSPKAMLYLAEHLGPKRPTWVQLGIAGARAARRVGGENFDWGNLARTFEWWREPVAGGTELLSMPWTTTTHVQEIQSALGDLVERGWQAPEELDGRLVQLIQTLTTSEFWKVLVRALPVAAEDRALAIAAAFPRGYAISFAVAALQAERPWHRLYARQLASAETADQVTIPLLNRDWTGAPPEAIEALEGLAKKWPRQSAGAGALPWHPALIEAFRRTPELPPSVVMPLVEGGSTEGWNALAARDPAAALDFARQHVECAARFPQALMEVLQKHGGTVDLELALALEVNLWGAPQLQEYFRRCCAGNPKLIALGVPGNSSPSRESVRIVIAKQAASGARVEDLAELLRLMPTLHQEVFSALRNVLIPQIGAAHTERLAQAATALLAQPMTSVWMVKSGARLQVSPPRVGNADVLLAVLEMLENTRDPRAQTVVKQVLAASEVPQPVVQKAAQVALATAGADLASLVLEMLAADRPEIVQAALVADVCRNDAAVQKARQQALLRTGARLQDVDAVAVAFGAEGRLQLAEAVLADPHYLEFASSLAVWAVATIGQRKDPARIPQLVAAGAHPAHEVRAQVAEALGITFARQAAPHLLELLKDDRAEVRGVAQKALDELANYLDARAKWEARLR